MQGLSGSPRIDERNCLSHLEPFASGLLEAMGPQPAGGGEQAVSWPLGLTVTKDYRFYRQTKLSDIARYLQRVENGALGGGSSVSPRAEGEREWPEGVLGWILNRQGLGPVWQMEMQVGNLLVLSFLL